MRLLWLTAALLGILALAGLAAALWRRFYRDDPANAARRVFKNSAVTFALRMVVKAMDMVVLFILAGTLAAGVLGDYDLAALLVGQYLVIFTEFGLGVLLTREVARDPGAARRLLGVTLALRLLLVLAGALPVALLVAGAYWALGQPLSPAGATAIFVLLLTLGPGAYSGAVTALYNASERMEVPALMELVTAALNFLARVAVIALIPSIVGLAWAAVAVSTVTAGAFFMLQRRHFFPPTVSFDRAAMGALVPVALPLMLNNLLSAVFFRFDVFIVRAFGGAAATLLVAQYTRPYQLLNIAMIVPPAVTFAVFPLLSRRAGGDRAGFAAAQNRTLQILLALAFPLAMGLSVLAYDLIRLFTRSQFQDYQPSVPVLAILAWFLPLSFANGLLQYALIALDRQRAITRAFVIGAAFNLVANLIVVPAATLALGRPDWALYAAAGITILSELVLYLVFRPLLRSEGMPPPLLALSWRPALAALAMGAAMIGLKALAPDWPGSVAAALTAPLVYGGALWALGGFGAEERALALRILGRAP
ncbi:MAG: oligosaccharide flippase family protein [Chloroflexales bacterium]|nr:oligosaccharide flippase family protein [Chloroflexales bacterium]